MFASNLVAYEQINFFHLLYKIYKNLFQMWKFSGQILWPQQFKEIIPLEIIKGELFYVTIGLKGRFIIIEKLLL